MKRMFNLILGCLMATAMMAGNNDLLWDYSEKQIPKSGPDNGLYYGAYVNDAPSTNLGLNGVKMNSSGYAYFTKAAVAGKLKLTFSPRKSGNSLKLAVWTWSSSEPAAQTQIAETSTVSDLVTEIIDLTAEQTNIYITRPSGTGEGVLQKIQFIEDVPRTFVDFKIEFRDNPYTVLLPESGELPNGVKIEGTSYNGGQHGVYGGTITVPVDGAVKFTIGACQHSKHDITVKKDGEYYATISNKDACGEQKPNYNQYVPYIYTGEAGTLTFEFGSQTYVPYFFAEATEIRPCTVTFKDQNGAELGKIETYEGANLDTLPDVSMLPELCDMCFFRGWFYSNNKKAKIGDPITGNTTIQAKATPYETATVGSVLTYDFTNATFYPEDHETVEVHGGEFHDAQHGWYFTGNESMFDDLGDIKGVINVSVAGKAVIVITACTHSETGTIEMPADEDRQWPGASFAVEKNVTPDGKEFVVEWPYDGAARLTFLLHNKQYIHKVVVYNVEDFLEKNEATGYYIVPANDAASFLLALAQAESGDKIFLQNGTYDLGETCLTTISKNNISIIGQSMEGVVIKNAPVTPGIGSTATLRIAKNVSGTYLQDLTLFDNFDYYKNNEGVGVALQDQGTQTVCKNVKLMGYQDTYYSNLIGAVKYFEDCEIHGTVDFICGDGSVYFYGTEMVCEQRTTGGGGTDAVTASNADANDKGYVFDHCTIRYAEDIQGTKPVVSFGRSWNNSPKTVFLYTFLDDSNGELNMYKNANAQKDKISRWTLGAMNALPEKFGEYYSVNAKGENITPSSNNVKFVLNSNEKQMETVLTADQAAIYTMDYTLGDWSATAKADAKQAVCEKTAAEFEPNGVYLVEAEGIYAGIILGSEFMDKFALYDGVNYTVRKANARGGFGNIAEEGGEEAIEDVQTKGLNTTKIVENGQVFIIKNGVKYSVLGEAVR